MDSASFRNIFSFSLKVSFIRGLLLVLIIFASAAPPAVAQTCVGIPDTECQALYALYNSTGGDGWIDNTNWLSTTVPVDDWYGISVYAGHVGSIVLRYNSLYGVIPPELGNPVPSFQFIPR